MSRPQRLLVEFGITESFFSTLTTDRTNHVHHAPRTRRADVYDCATLLQTFLRRTRPLRNISTIAFEQAA